MTGRPRRGGTTRRGTSVVAGAAVVGSTAGGAPAAASTVTEGDAHEAVTPTQISATTDATPRTTGPILEGAAPARAQPVVSPAGGTGPAGSTLSASPGRRCGGAPGTARVTPSRPTISTATPFTRAAATGPNMRESIATDRWSPRRNSAPAGTVAAAKGAVTPAGRNGSGTAVPLTTIASQRPGSRSGQPTRSPPTPTTRSIDSYDRPSASSRTKTTSPRAGARVRSNTTPSSTRTVGSIAELGW